jgi:hypothetical protein
MDKILVGENIELCGAEENVGVIFILVLVLSCWWYRDCRAKRFI